MLPAVVPSSAYEIFVIMREAYISHMCRVTKIPLMFGLERKHNQINHQLIFEQSLQAQKAYFIIVHYLYCVGSKKWININSQCLPLLKMPLASGWHCCSMATRKISNYFLWSLAPPSGQNVAFSQFKCLAVTFFFHENFFCINTGNKQLPMWYV